MFENYKMAIKIVLHAIIIIIIIIILLVYSDLQFYFLTTHKIAKASLGEQCLYKTKKALQMVIN